MLLLHWASMAVKDGIWRLRVAWLEITLDSHCQSLNNPTTQMACPLRFKFGFPSRFVHHRRLQEQRLHHRIIERESFFFQILPMAPIGQTFYPFFNVRFLLQKL